MIGFIAGNLGRGISVRNLSRSSQFKYLLCSHLLGSFLAVVGMPLTTALASRDNLELVRSLFCFEFVPDFLGIS